MTKLECKQIFAMLSEYLDRTLPAELCDTIETHIEGCPPCVEFVRTLEKTVDFCQRFQPGEQPSPIPDEVRQKLLDSLAQLRNSPSSTA